MICLMRSMISSIFSSLVLGLLQLVPFYDYLSSALQRLAHHSVWSVLYNLRRGMLLALWNLLNCGSCPFVIHHALFEPKDPNWYVEGNKRGYNTGSRPIPFLYLIT
jgi:hypothetical protein